MKFIAYVKKGQVNGVLNTDTKALQQYLPDLLIHELERKYDGLYICDVEKSSILDIERILLQETVHTQGDKSSIRWILTPKDYYRITEILQVDCFNYSYETGYTCFNFKKPAKRFYELGTEAELAYGEVEFNCGEEEAYKYKYNAISCENGVVRAYRYKFTFFYMMNSNRNITARELSNYTKDMTTYVKYNPTCNTLHKVVDGVIQDGVFL